MTIPNAGRWLTAALYANFLLWTLPVMPLATRWLARSAGRWALGGMALAVVAAALVGTFVVARRQALSGLAVAGVGSCYGAFAWWLSASPNEITHLVQYGVLGALLYWARPTGAGPLIAAIGASLIGFLDELTQDVLPSRYFNWHDVGANVLAGFLVVALIGIARGLRPWQLRAFWLGRSTESAGVAARSVTAALLALGLVSGAASAGAAAETPPPGRRPNVLLITVDSFRPDHVGAYGYDRPTTPVLDALAARGARFDNAYANGHWTLPSMVSMLTGLVPPAHGIENRGEILDPSVVTLADLLVDAGYHATAYEAEHAFTNMGFVPLPDPERDGVVSLERIVGAGQEPFLCWLHVKKPHLPYAAPDPFPAQFLRAPLATTGDLARRQWIVRNRSVLPRERIRFLPEDRDWIVDLYDAEVAAQDARIGEFLETLERLGVADQTIVVVSADHGEELLDHGHVGHASTTHHSVPFEELIRIPLIVHAPGSGLAPRVVTAPVQLEDLLPTIAELVGVEVPAGVGGESRSLVPLLRGEGEGRDLVFASATPCGFNCPDRRRDDRIHVVSDLDWKLVRFSPGRGPSSEVLYDLRGDPGELTPRLATGPDAARLRSRLDAWLAAARDTRARLPPTLPLLLPPALEASEVEIDPAEPAPAAPAPAAPDAAVRVRP